MVTKDTSSSVEFLNNAEYRDPVERLVCRSGVRPDMSGYPLLVDAVMLYGTYELKNFASIYAAIGAARNKNVCTVKRAINYAVTAAPLAEFLTKRIGVPLGPDPMATGCAIAYLSKALFYNDELRLS